MTIWGLFSPEANKQERLGLEFGGPVGSALHGVVLLLYGSQQQANAPGMCDRDRGAKQLQFSGDMLSELSTENWRQYLPQTNLGQESGSRAQAYVRKWGDRTLPDHVDSALWEESGAPEHQCLTHIGWFPRYLGPIPVTDGAQCTVPISFCHWKQHPPTVSFSYLLVAYEVVHHIEADAILWPLP